MPPSEQVKKVPGSSVAYLNTDPYVFGPPGSGSVSTRHGSGSGSGSFYHQAEIVRKTLIPTVLLLLYYFLSLKNDVHVSSKSYKQKNLGKKKKFNCRLEGHGGKKNDLEPDPDP
jgi:hypothetical protein